MEKRTLILFLFLFASIYLFAQEIIRKVDQDTLFFNYDHSYLIKTLPDLNLVCLAEETNSTSLPTSLNFELEEIRIIKTNNVINLKSYLQRKAFII